jgi:glyoxylase-like metal-dependent hydrolase (beta-lactamase superfamily II)
MLQEIKPINLGGVNCYLVKTDDDFIMIDTGYSTQRADLERELEKAGCRPGNLKLVVLTHGDADHAGNGAYLREKYGAKIAMHQCDSGMVERGDMSWNRKAKPDKLSITFRIMMFFVGLLSRSVKFDLFKPDLTVDEGFDLSEYGFDAKVLHIPGHSEGSIGILTTGGDLFCGDLLYNMPGFLFIDDLANFTASLEKLRSLTINTVYPGHGKPFSLELFMKKNRYLRSLAPADASQAAS